MRTTRTVGGPDDPRIQKIREMRVSNPSFTRHQAYLTLGVAPKLMERWIENGWVEPFPAFTRNVNSPWSQWRPKK